MYELMEYCFCALQNFLQLKYDIFTALNMGKRQLHIYVSVKNKGL